MFNNCWVAGGGEGLGYACYGGILMAMTSYTKRCTKIRRVCWCKFGRNPTKSFCVICILVSMSLFPRQGLSLDFACLPIYSLAISPELFVCLSIYENAETLSRKGVIPCFRKLALTGASWYLCFWGLVVSTALRKRGLARGYPPRLRRRRIPATSKIGEGSLPRFDKNWWGEFA